MSRRRERTLAAAGVLALGPLAPARCQDAPPAATAPAHEPAVDDEARAVLRRMSDHYRALDHLAVKVTSTFAVRPREEAASGAHQDFEATAEYDFAFTRPAMIAMRGASGLTGGDISCDGHRMYVFVPRTNRYVELEAPREIELVMTVASNTLKLTGVPSGGMDAVALLALLGDDPAKALMAESSRVRSLGVHEVDGRPLHQIRFTEAEGHLDFWVDAGPQPWLVRIDPNLARLPEGLGRAVSVTMRVDFRDWSAAAVPPERFTFEPPADARRVDTLMEAMGVEPRPPEPVPGETGGGAG
jgi:hypothetical protein